MEELEGGGDGMWWQNLREVVMQCRRAATKKADNGPCGSGQRVSEDNELPAMAAQRSIGLQPIIHDGASIVRMEDQPSSCGGPPTIHMEEAGLHPIIHDGPPTVHMEEVGLQPIICNGASIVRMEQAGLQPIIRDGASIVRMEEVGLQPIIHDGPPTIHMEKVGLQPIIRDDPPTVRMEEVPGHGLQPIIISAHQHSAGYQQAISSQQSISSKQSGSKSQTHQCTSKSQTQQNAPPSQNTKIFVATRLKLNISSCANKLFCKK